MSRIRQMFGDELAGRIFAAAYDKQEEELPFLRRIVDEALPARAAVQTVPTHRVWGRQLAVVLLHIIEAIAVALMLFLMLTIWIGWTA